MHIMRVCDKLLGSRDVSLLASRWHFLLMSRVKILHRFETNNNLDTLEFSSLDPRSLPFELFHSGWNDDTHLSTQDHDFKSA